MPVNLSTSLTEIKGIGPGFLMKFKRLGILTVKNLLWHFPSRYEDWSEVANIEELIAGDSKTIHGIVQSIEVKRLWQRKMVIVEALIADDSGSIKAVWFNQPYIKNILKEGVAASFAGKVSERKRELYLSNPTYELINKNFEGGTHTGRLVPIYPETRGLTSKGIRMMTQKVLDSLDKVPEFMPESILIKNELPEINQALWEMHFPDTRESAERAGDRFAFEELFLLQLNNLYQKIALAKEKAPVVESETKEIETILKSLPFRLTPSQEKSILEILGDIKRPRPMNRLLQGDVGSGKTIVAGIAAIVTAKKNHQVAIMAPTEILARQHYKTLTKFFNDFRGGIGLLLSKESRIFYGDELETKTKKNSFIKSVTDGKIKIVIGTHALIQKNVNFKNLALVIVDEQHRFGVKQRAALMANTETVPHFLSMSATPIPRTIMMTMFGDLDLSIISELPKGRKEIVTKVVDRINRDKAYAFIRGQVRRGRQVFVICPRIEPEENELVTWATLQTLQIKSVKEEYEKLKKKVFPDLKVAMLHGKMKSQEKEKTMSDFSRGEIDILVSTSVVEVGVDVPNATIMMIEGSERFGLAQLYQFRGRVGRGEHQSFCFLFTESEGRAVQERLRSLINAKNGFELAEKDLRLRGPGEFLGNEQTGMPDIAMRALKDPDLIKTTREEAQDTIRQDPNLKNLPNLKARFKEFQREVHLE